MGVVREARITARALAPPLSYGWRPPLSTQRWLARDQAPLSHRRCRERERWATGLAGTGSRGDAAIDARGPEASLDLPLCPVRP